MFDRLADDVRTALTKDPAAKSALEVVLTYPGVHAVWFHRVAHRLYAADHQLAARVLSHLVRGLTGVEIHPAADVGDRLFVDHGMGVVVGETARIGDDVHLFHGVTLGGNSPRPEKRHPTLEDDVVVGANATLVGDITVGAGARVGAGAVVVDDVRPGETVVGNPARPVGDSDSNSDSDPEAGERDEAPVEETRDGVDADPDPESDRDRIREREPDPEDDPAPFDGTPASSRSTSPSPSDCQG
jgi:serine O-acetyltransferase